MNLKTAFKRPRAPEELAAVKVTIHRAVAKGDLKQTKLNYYYVPNWFERLAEKDAWVMKDLFINLAIKFNNASKQSIILSDSDPASMRRVAKFLRDQASELTSYADAIEFRVSELEIENSETEDTD